MLSCLYAGCVTINHRIEIRTSEYFSFNLFSKQVSISLKYFLSQAPMKECAAILLEKAIQWLCVLGKWSQSRQTM